MNTITNIIRHIRLVENNCNKIAEFYERDDISFALELVRRGRRHDVSKLNNLEFEELHRGHENFHIALHKHRTYNDHHPEYWKSGIASMSEGAIAEMVCDWMARSQEFGDSIDEWAFKKAPILYGYSENDATWDKIKKYLNILTDTRFDKI